MLKEMCWLPRMGAGANGEKILHLRTAPNQPWKPYTSCPEYSVQDYREPGGSKGWATYQKLLTQGWKLVPSFQQEQRKTA